MSKQYFFLPNCRSLLPSIFPSITANSQILQDTDLIFLFCFVLFFSEITDDDECAGANGGHTCEDDGACTNIYGSSDGQAGYICDCPDANQYWDLVDKQCKGK